MAVVVDHEGAPLLEDEPDGGPDCDAGEGAEQLVIAVSIGSVVMEADLKRKNQSHVSRNEEPSVLDGSIGPG